MPVERASGSEQATLPGPLVSAEWLRDHLSEVTVVDVRWYLHVPGTPARSGLAEYEAGHIPGAIHLDIDTDLSAPANTSAGRHPLPSEAAFAAALGRMGIADALARAIADGTATVYDARTADRCAHGGPIDPRPGHIPGARNRPWQQNLSSDGRFLPAEQLRAAYDTDRTVIAYCGSGVTACHDLLALAVAGVEDTALYPGSWSQWGADPSRPAETG